MRTERGETALVTGAGGFIGSHLLKFLLARGWQVIGGYRSRDSNSLPSHPNFQAVHFDLRNSYEVGSFFRLHKPTYVFHLAAQSLPTSSWVDPVPTFESNIMGSLHLFQAVRRTSSQAVVVSACSSAEYGHVLTRETPVTERQPLRPLHPYGISKVCLDLLAREYFIDHNIQTINIRLFNTSGPGKVNDAPSDFVRQLVRIEKGLQPPIVKVGNLRTYRAFLDVSDTVRGFYLAAIQGKRGESYNLCAAKAYQIGQLLKIAIRLSGLKVQVRPSHHLMRPSDEKIIFGSSRKFRRDTDWRPRKSLEEILISMFNYWKRMI